MFVIGISEIFKARACFVVLLVSSALLRRPLISLWFPQLSFENASISVGNALDCEEMEMTKLGTRYANETWHTSVRLYVCLGVSSKWCTKRPTWKRMGWNMKMKSNNQQEGNILVSYDQMLVCINAGLHHQQFCWPEVLILMLVVGDSRQAGSWCGSSSSRLSKHDKHIVLGG